MSKKNNDNSTGKAIASAIARITYRDIKQEQQQQDRYKAQPDEEYQPLFKKYPLGGRY